MKTLAMFLLALLCACSLDLSEKRSCIRQSDCNDGWSCSAGTCVRGHSFIGDGDGDGDGDPMDAGVDAGNAADAGADAARDAGPPEGLALWLRASVEVLNAGGVPAAEKEKVARWADHSGHGFDAKQVPTDYQPLFEAHSGPNKGPAVVFDGENDLLSLGSNYIFADEGQLGMMFFLVVRGDKDLLEPPHDLDAGEEPTDPFLMSFGSGGNNDWALFYDFDTVSFRATTTQLDYTTHSVGEGNWTILTYELVFGQALRARIDGEDAVADSAELVPRLTAEEIDEAPTRESGAGPIVIGGQAKLELAAWRYFGGAIAEIRVFNRALVPDARDAIECELSKTHGIPLNSHHEDCPP